MTFAWSELLQSGLATLALPLFFIAPGYVAGSFANVFHFRQQSILERLLWSVALSVPLSLLLCVHAGLEISPAWTLRILELISVAAALLLFQDLRRDNAVARIVVWDRNATICTLAALALVFYCLLSASPIQTSHGLFENAAWQDWNIRIQLVNAAIRGGNHPTNPMFARAGVSPALHYYYFWYVLCAQIARLTGTGARAALTASCVGASMALLSCIFLSLKYLGISTHHLRRQCTAALLVGCVMGLDILVALLSLFPFHRRLLTDPQFWLDDRSPAWLHLLLWSPHHVAGLVCCLIAVILVLHSQKRSIRQRLTHIVLAAACFAAASGTSTFVTAFFVVVCVAIVIAAALSRQWSVAGAMIAAGLLALIIASPFLRSMTKQHPGSLHSHRVSVQSAFKFRSALKFRVRYVDQSRDFALRIYRMQHGNTNKEMAPTPLVQTERFCFVAAMFVADFGFFLFVLIYRIRKDFFRPGRMDRNRRALWLIFLCIAIPGFLLTSWPLSDNNDLGRHAGMCLRFIMLLWSAPLLVAFTQRRKFPQLAPHGINLLFQRLAITAFVLGLLGQVWQIFVTRFDAQLVNAGDAPPYVVAMRAPHIAMRFLQIHQAMDFADRATPRNAIVQWNPHQRLQPVYMLYTKRQMAAGDDGCNFHFGGSLAACLPMSKALIELFGGSGHLFQGQSKVLPQIPYQPGNVTPQNFKQICQDDHLSMLVATYSDPAWWHTSSWVWQLHPAYANATSRVFDCRIAENIPPANPHP